MAKKVSKKQVKDKSKKICRNCKYEEDSCSMEFHSANGTCNYGRWDLQKLFSE